LIIEVGRGIAVFESVWLVGGYSLLDPIWMLVVILLKLKRGGENIR